MIPCAVMVRLPSGRRFMDSYRPGRPYYPGPAAAWRRAIVIARASRGVAVTVETCNGARIASITRATDGAITIDTRRIP